MTNAVSQLPNFDQSSISNAPKAPFRESNEKYDATTASRDIHERNFKETFNKETKSSTDKVSTADRKTKDRNLDNKEVAEVEPQQNLPTEDVTTITISSTNVVSNLPEVPIALVDSDDTADALNQPLTVNTLTDGPIENNEEPNIGSSTIVQLDNGFSNRVGTLGLNSTDQLTDSSAMLPPTISPQDNNGVVIEKSAIPMGDDASKMQTSTHLDAAGGLAIAASAAASVGRKPIDEISSELSIEDIDENTFVNSTGINDTKKSTKPEYLSTNSDTLLKSPSDRFFAKNGAMGMNSQLLGESAKDSNQSFSEQLEAIKIEDKATKFSNGQVDGLSIKPNISNSDKAFVSANIRFGAPGWAGQIAERSANLASQNIKNAEIHLNPQDMGPIHIKISVANEQASISFSAQNAQVREALDSTMQRLKDALSEEGLDLVQADIQDQQTQQQRQQQSQSQWGAAVEQTDEATAQHAVYIPKSVVDHFV